MTIAAAYLVSEGVVLGADSSTTISFSDLQRGTGVLQIFNYAQKIFQVGENSRLGVCTWGSGSYGAVSHRTVVARLADQVNENTSVDEAAHTLMQLAVPLARDANIDFVGYYLGGRDPGTHDPACHMIEIRNGQGSVNPLGIGLCSFSGVPKFFNRVFRGFDPDLTARLFDEISKRLPDEVVKNGNFRGIYDEAFSQACAPLVAAGYQDMPMREAIDFVYSYLYITIKALKFSFGAPACGGPIEIGFITSDRNFRWARHKNFGAAIAADEGEENV